MAPTILMTGANGFVAPYLNGALAARLPEARLFGLRSGRDPRQASAQPIACRDVDLLDQGAVDAAVAEARPDVVLHLAAQASVGQARADPDATWRVNVTGTLNLALAAVRHAPGATWLFTSSSEVYGGRCSAGPVDEAATPQPLNAYARSKLVAERILADVLAPATRLIVARPFNHTGPGQREDFVLPSFARQIARIEAGRQEPVLRVGNLDASRDFLDVADVADAYVALLAAADHLPKRFTVNVASGHPRRLRDLLAAMGDMAHRPFRVEVDPARLRADDVPIALGDASLLRRATGWVPRVPIESTLARLLASARALPD